MPTKIISNKIRCLRCKVVLESKHRHDFVLCGCDPPVGVDGGLEYLKRTGSPGHMEELSEVHND